MQYCWNLFSAILCKHFVKTSILKHLAKDVELEQEAVIITLICKGSTCGSTKYLAKQRALRVKQEKLHLDGPSMHKSCPNSLIHQKTIHRLLDLFPVEY